MIRRTIVPPGARLTWIRLVAFLAFLWLSVGVPSKASAQVYLVVEGKLTQVDAPPGNDVKVRWAFGHPSELTETRLLWNSYPTPERAEKTLEGWQQLERMLNRYFKRNDTHYAECVAPIALVPARKETSKLLERAGAAYERVQELQVAATDIETILSSQGEEEIAAAEYGSVFKDYLEALKIMYARVKALDAVLGKSTETLEHTLDNFDAAFDITVERHQRLARFDLRVRDPLVFHEDWLSDSFTIPVKEGKNSYTLAYSSAVDLSDAVTVLRDNDAIGYSCDSIRSTDGANYGTGFAITRGDDYRSPVPENGHYVLKLRGTGSGHELRFSTSEKAQHAYQDLLAWKRKPGQRIVFSRPKPPGAGQAPKSASPVPPRTFSSIIDEAAAEAGTKPGYASGMKKLDYYGLVLDRGTGTCGREAKILAMEYALFCGTREEFHLRLGIIASAQPYIPKMRMNDEWRAIALGLPGTTEILANAKIDLSQFMTFYNSTIRVCTTLMDLDFSHWKSRHLRTIEEKGEFGKWTILDTHWPVEVRTFANSGTYTTAFFEEIVLNADPQRLKNDLDWFVAFVTTSTRTEVYWHDKFGYDIPDGNEKHGALYTNGKIENSDTSFRVKRRGNTIYLQVTKSISRP